jgi:hypothetical protein
MFLDIKAAYDSVDHNILLTKLMEKDCAPPLLRIVQQLMTGITSTIMVNGVESEEFEHKAGVLQGSIISPLLYSLYINDLAEAVRTVAPGLQRVFLYADDVAIIVDNEEQIKTITDALEAHSHLNNYRYNPRKCEILNTSATTATTIYGERMTRCERFKYLGCWIDQDGIRWTDHLRELQARTKQVLNFFRSVGFNSGGYRERTRIMLFKTFLRPLWEYCLPIMPHSKRNLDLLNRLQHECLTSMFSMYKNVSQSALRALTGIPCVHKRYRELQARWHVRLDPKNASHMIKVAMMNSKNKFLKTKSCFAEVQRWKIRKREQPEWEIQDEILAARKQHLEEMAEKSQNLKQMKISSDCKPKMLYSLSRCSRRTARLCTLWMLNRIPGKPRPCRNCGGDKKPSSHFKECCGAQGLDDLIGNMEWTTALRDIKRITEAVVGLEFLLDST